MGMDGVTAEASGFLFLTLEQRDLSHSNRQKPAIAKPNERFNAAPPAKDFGMQKTMRLFFYKYNPL